LRETAKLQVVFTHTQFRRHRLDAHLDGAGPDDDGSRTGPVLRRHGAQEERGRHRIGLWAIFVYSPIAHWVWGPDGFLAAANTDAWVKVLDFAGGTVVHINSGVAGLMACLLLGKRKDTGPNHNMVLTSSAPRCCGSAGSASTPARP
jgi:hypothetical protein